MSDVSPPIAGEVNNPHELRDISVSGVVTILIGLTVTAVILHIGLWFLYRYLAPPSGRGVSLPVKQPHEANVNARIMAIPEPRIDSLYTLDAQPPTYRSSQPLVESNSRNIHAEDLRAERQPLLTEYGWVDRDKGIARIPIEKAMDALLKSGKLKSTSKPGGRP